MRTFRAACVVLLLLGCDQKDPGAVGGACEQDPDEAQFYPLQPGAWWRHHMTDPMTGVCDDKVVHVDPAIEMPLRPGVVAFPVKRETHNEFGIRWQEVRGDAVFRHVDEWFARDMTRTQIVYYCPAQLRVSASVDAMFDDDVAQTTVQAITPEDWAICETIAVDATTCQATTDVDTSRCNVTTVSRQTHWTRVDADVPQSGPAAGITDLVAWLIQADGEPDTTYVWARGLGKVSEFKSAVQRDELVDCCLPSTGCTRPAPSLPASCL